MAQGEYFELRCVPPPYGTDNTADNYSCINPPNICAGFVYTGEKCNGVPDFPTTVMANDDYSLTFKGTMPVNTDVYTPAWYTCEGWLNPAYASSVPTPDLSEVQLNIFARYGSGVEYTETQNITITLTDPADLTVTGGVWTYTTDPCQCNGYGVYRISVTYKWDYSSSPVTVNNFGCWSDTYITSSFGSLIRIPIGIEWLLGDPSDGPINVGGTLGTYDTAAGCALMPAPNTNGNGRPRRNRIR